MSVIDIDTQARWFFEQFGPEAMAIVAQKARKLEEQGDAAQAEAWRRVEARLAELRGPPES